MAFTIQQLSILEEAIAQGALSVEYGDKKVTYRSLEEMKQIRDGIRQELGVIDNTGMRKFGDFSKGL